jgi:hypothetical protein
MFTIDDDSDDEIDATTFAPNAPLTPPHSNVEGRKLPVASYIRDVLKLNVHHGDIIIQQGAGLQKYYEVISVEMSIDGSMLRYHKE